MASMDSRLIVSGQPVNVLASYSQGQQTGAQANQIRRTNEMENLYRSQGAGIANGDQNALNALASLDPNAALGVQKDRLGMDQTRLGMDSTRQNMSVQREQLQMAKESAKRAAQQHVMSMSTAERQAEAAKLERGLAGATQINDEKAWDDYATANGLPQLAGRFGEKDIIIAQALGVSEALKMAEPPKPADEYGRYAQEEQAAGREPLSRIDFAQAKKGSEIIYGPNGEPIVERGPGNKPPKLTVDAAKNTGFLIRTQEANQTLYELEDQGTKFWQQGADKAPMGLGNYARTPEFQKFDQARRDFVNSILRRESGAVISDQEFDNANKQYFPVPGDGPEVIDQKRRNRETAIEGLRVGSGAGADYVDAKKPAEQQQSRIPDFKAMSDEELDAWISENGE